jgi:hypothetical protein
MPFYCSFRPLYFRRLCYRIKPAMRSFASANDQSSLLRFADRLYDLAPTLTPHDEE